MNISTILLFSSWNSQMRYVLLISLYWWENWGSEVSYNFPKVILY